MSGNAKQNENKHVVPKGYNTLHLQGNNIETIIGDGFRIEFNKAGGVTVISAAPVTVLTSRNDNVVSGVGSLKRELEIGDKDVDGFIYAGISPETNQPFYIKPVDEPCSGAGMSWHKAREAARKQGLRMPEGGEIKMMFNNLGGFEKDRAYWTNREKSEKSAYYYSPHTREVDLHYKNDRHHVRLVRDPLKIIV